MVVRLRDLKGFTSHIFSVRSVIIRFTNSIYNIEVCRKSLEDNPNNGRDREVNTKPLFEKIDHRHTNKSKCNVYIDSGRPVLRLSRLKIVNSKKGINE